MAAKSARHFMPGASESAEFAHLSEAPKPKPPRAVLKPVDRSDQPNRLNGLSDKQKSYMGGLLGTAVERVREEAKERKCRWLRDFDCFQLAGNRTYQQRWDSLADIIEPMLARLDIATMTLGWLDAQGEYHLNRQRGLSEDSKSREWTVSRTLKALESAKLVRRKFRKIRQHGTRWITRVTIHIRPRFFIQLGLGYLLAEVRTEKKAKRAGVLKALGKNRNDNQTKADVARYNRQQREDGKERAQRKRDGERQADANVEYRRQWTMAYAVYAKESGLKEPHLSRAFMRDRPQFAVHPATLP
jgi:hypothetical protein